MSSPHSPHLDFIPHSPHPPIISLISSQSSSFSLYPLVLSSFFRALLTPKMSITVTQFKHNCKASSQELGETTNQSSITKEKQLSRLKSPILMLINYYPSVELRCEHTVEEICTYATLQYVGGTWAMCCPCSCVYYCLKEEIIHRDDTKGVLDTMGHTI